MLAEQITGLKFAIDMDETIVNTPLSFPPAAKRLLDLDLTDQDPEQILGYLIKTGRLVEAMRAFFPSEEFESTLPIEGAVPVLTTLHQQGNELLFLTSRPIGPEYGIRERSIRWIRTHLPDVVFPEDDEQFPFFQALSPIIAKINPDDEEGRKLPTKGQVCKDKEIDFVIDNSLGHIIEVVTTKHSKTKGILFDPRNKHTDQELPHSSVRVSEWLRMPEAIAVLIG